MKNYKLFKNAILVNEGRSFESDLLVYGDKIKRIDRNISHPEAEVIDVNGKLLIPGCIDDQVHFREPGLTHKADIHTESSAALAGGVTSFMEMPNTIPNALTPEILEAKYEIAAQKSMANYSFYMGVSNDNLDHVLRVNYDQVCGIKVFMGSSTGGMLVDEPNTLEALFSRAPVLIATHCEDEATIRKNLEKALIKYGNKIPESEHPIIRNHEACMISSGLAISLAQKHGTRLHVLHLTTAQETERFNHKIPLENKRITSEVCVHHLYFDDRDYARLGNLIKCNPAIKTEIDKQTLCKALKEGKIDVIATDHAPHTLEEKSRDYLEAPSGLPLVQHPLNIMLTLGKEHGWGIEFIVEKMAHNPAICFGIKNRGFLREEYFADLVILDPTSHLTVRKEDLLYKCGWSPLEGAILEGKILSTFVNGHLAFDGHKVLPISHGARLSFDRN